MCPAICDQTINSKLKTCLCFIRVRAGLGPIRGFIFSQQPCNPFPRIRRKWQIGEKLALLRRCPLQSVDLINPRPSLPAKPAPDKPTRELHESTRLRLKQHRQHFSINSMRYDRPEGNTYTPGGFDCLCKFQNPFYTPGRKYCCSSTLPTLIKFPLLLLIIAHCLIEIESALTKVP